jgi:hypothetical protein
VRDVALVVGLSALAALFALLVRHKERTMAKAAETAAPLGVLRLGATLRGGLAGVLLSGGIALQMAAMPTLGAASVAAALLLSAMRAPDVKPAARGPGKWLAVTPDEAFAKARGMGHWLDTGTTAGKITAVVAAAAVAAGAFLVRRIDAEAPFLVVLDALVLGPLFFTGRAAQLPPDLAKRPARRLRALYARLRRTKRKHGKQESAIRVVPWARVPTGQSSPDELRLLALPRVAMPGLLGIEVGVAWARTPTGYDGDLEVLVRVQESTYAAARLTALAPRVRPVPGRREGERVVRLVPRSGTHASAAALVERLAGEMTDRRRRVPERVWEGAERRVPPNARVVQAAA